MSIFKLRSQPLSTAKQEIRLLLINPSQTFDAMVSCSLHTVSLHDYMLSRPNDTGVSEKTSSASRPNNTSPNIRRYEVLFCVHSPERVPEESGINGQKLLVPGSLCNALRHIRRREHQTWVWCEELCINEHNEGELTEHIVLMPHIYGHADALQIWIDGVQNLRYSSITARLLSLELNLRSYAQTWDEYLNILDCLEGFTAHTWFHRLSIVQKVALSNSVYLNIERIPLRWTASSISDLSSRASSLFNYLQESLCNTNQSTRALEFVAAARLSKLSRDLEVIGAIHECAYDVVSYMKSGSGQQWGAAFYKLVMKCRYAPGSASHNRVHHDRVHGLLGLAPEHVVRKLAGIKSVEDSYTVWTSMAIALTGSLEVLEHARAITVFTSVVEDIDDDSIDRTLDWKRHVSRPLSTWILNLMLRPRPLSTLISHISSFHCTSGTLEPQAWISQIGRVLCTPGLELDAITTVIHTSRSAVWQDQVLVLIRDMIAALKIDFRQQVAAASRYVAGGSLELAVWKTLNFGLPPVKGRPHVSINTKDKVYQHLFQPEDLELFRVWHSTLISNESKKNITITHIPNILTHGPDNAHFSVFVTERGYVGVGFGRNIYPSDCVFVLPGGRLPFVLRSVRPESQTMPPTLTEYENLPSFSLIAPAYVAGIMNGETLDTESPIYNETWRDWQGQRINVGKGTDLELRWRVMRDIFLT